MPDNAMVTKAATDIITSRTLYHQSPRWTGTFLTSKAVPIYANSTIRPGDTVSLDLSQVLRGTTPVFPVMDDAFVSVECFFVKHKNLLNRSFMSPSVNDSNHSFRAWIGAQDSLLNMPLPDNDIKLPYMKIGTTNYGGYLVGGLADDLTYPMQQSATPSNWYKVNCLKVLAYYSVWNSYLRDPNLQNPVTFTIATDGNGDPYCTVVGTDAGIPAGGTEWASALPLAGVCREHGFFGSCLPWPQRNTDAINLPLGTIAPVITSLTDHHTTAGNTLPGLRFYNQTGTPGPVTDGMVATNAYGYTDLYSRPSSEYKVADIYPANLWADLSTATAATVNQVRYAFATQRWFEQLARSGNRYDELVYGMTGVRQADSYDDRPEYLGGKRIPITQSQVNATSSTDLGKVGAFSHMADNDYYFTKSFDDFGTLIIIAFVRVKDTFAQGVQMEDQVFSKFDMFWSQFANIGEVPIRNAAIYVQADSNDNGVFGYQEAWANYRLALDNVCGLCRPGQSMDYVTYANDFSSLPTLKSFITGDQISNVDNTLAVQSTASGFQWIAQFQFNLKLVRQVPLYSIPGYLDHH